MADNKTKATSASVRDFVDAVENDTRRSDAKQVIKMFRAVTGKKPTMWGPTIIGFGVSHYKLASGKEESICRIGFSPRKANLVFYMTSDYAEYEDMLARLGKYKRSKCLYINKLADVDLDVLETMMRKSWEVSGKTNSSSCT